MLSGNIWKASKGDTMTFVNKQKLQKAEAKSREKAEKKLIKEQTKAATPKPVTNGNDSGTVSEEKKNSNIFLLPPLQY